MVFDRSRRRILLIELGRVSLEAEAEMLHITSEGSVHPSDCRRSYLELLHETTDVLLHIGSDLGDDRVGGQILLRLPHGIPTPSSPFHRRR